MEKVSANACTLKQATPETWARIFQHFVTWTKVYKAWSARDCLGVLPKVGWTSAMFGLGIWNEALLQQGASFVLHVDILQVQTIRKRGHYHHTRYTETNWPCEPTALSRLECASRERLSCTPSLAPYTNPPTRTKEPPWCTRCWIPSSCPSGCRRTDHTSPDWWPSRVVRAVLQWSQCWPPSITRSGACWPSPGGSSETRTMVKIRRWSNEMPLLPPCWRVSIRGRRRWRNDGCARGAPSGSVGERSANLWHASSWRRLKVCTHISRVVRYNVGEKEGDVCPVLYD